MNITNIDITLDKIATVKDCEGVIPITKPENTAIASAIPKAPGVIVLIIAAFLVYLKRKKKAKTEYITVFSK